MNYCRKLSPLFGALALTFAFPSLAKAVKLDLDREKPVPSTEQIPVQDFFRLEILRNPTVNLSGTKIAAIVSAGEDHTGMIVYDLKTQKFEPHTVKGDSDIDSVSWLNDDLVLFTVSYQKAGSYAICAGHPGTLDQAYPVLQNINAQVIVVPPNDRTHPLARLSPHSSNTGQYGEVVTLDAKVQQGGLLNLAGSGAVMSPEDMDNAREWNVRHIVGTHPVLETPDGFDLEYWADREGKLAFAESSTKGVLALHRLEGDKWVKCPEDLDQIDIVDGGENPGEILVLGARREGKPRALEILNAADGSSKGVLLEDPAYDFDGNIYRDPVDRKILGVAYDTAIPKNVWFDEEFRKLQTTFEGLPVFKGQKIHIVGNSADRTGFMIAAWSDTHPIGYYWADLKAKTFGPIKNTRPWIDPARMLPTGLIKYKTRDGRKLDAYVTMPAGATKQNPPPLVVMSNYSVYRATWGFDPEVQFFASRGYAVLQPNTRQARGYTGMFPEEDQWDFQKVYQDVIDATNTIVGSGLVDRNRVAIFGTGRGGYMSLCGAAYAPGLYRCAIAVSPYTVDWEKAIKEQKYFQYSNSWYARMVLRLGDPKANPAKFDALAPLRHANDIRSAVLIANGENDLTYETKGGKELVSIVKKNGNAGETISFVNERGGISHLGHQVELYTRIEKFLAENMGSAGRAATP